MADLSFADLLTMSWLPPKSKQVEIYATNVSSVTINPKLGYRHKLLNITITGMSLNPTTLDHEAVDIVLGAKTLMRYPAWLWGDNFYSISGLDTITGTLDMPIFTGTFIQKNILDLLPDAAEDEPMTLSVVSGTSYPVIDVKYAEYPSDTPLAHDVPGGSDYYRKLFFAWFRLLSTTVGNGQQLVEYGEPFGMSLLGQNGAIPPNKVFHQFGIISGYQNANQNSGITNYTVYNALHEWKNDEELFTPDTHSGLYCNQQSSEYITDTSLALWKQIRRYVDFNPNDRLNLYADVTSVTGSGSALWVVLDGVLEDLSKKPAGAGAPA